MKGETLIVGLGSPHGDDQFGWRVAEELARPPVDPRVAVRLAREPTEILGWLDSAERVMICDACQNLGSPGAIHLWRWPEPALASPRACGSHDLGVWETLELAASLGRLPADVSIWCAEGTGFVPGEAMSAALEAALADMVGRIRRDLRAQSVAARTQSLAPGTRDGARPAIGEKSP